MDSKRVYKKISTIFWFMLATLPIIITIFGYLFSFFIHTDSLTSAADIVSTITPFKFDTLLRNNSNFFINLTPSFITDMFRSLFVSFSISGQSSDLLKGLFGWFCWVYMIEIMVDVFVWLPRFFHSLLDKGVGKID